MNKVYESAFKFVRWGITAMFSLIVAFPAFTSFSTAI
jgi:hypothetical protein